MMPSDYLQKIHVESEGALSFLSRGVSNVVITQEVFRLKYVIELLFCYVARGNMILVHYSSLNTIGCLL